MTYDPSSSPPLPRNMRLKQVLEVFPISKSSLYAKMKASSPYFDSTFPQPFYLPKSRIPLWRAAEIETWLDSCERRCQDAAIDAPLKETTVEPGLTQSPINRRPRTIMLRNGCEVTVRGRRPVMETTRSSPAAGT